MEKKEKNEDMDAIVNRVKSEVREGMAGKKMTLTDISLKMTEALGDMREALVKEIEEVIQEEQDTKAQNCPECGNKLKKNEKQGKKKAYSRLLDP